MLRPQALNHVDLTVTDMDKTLHFYQALGLELLRTSDLAEGGRSAVLKVGVQEINVFSKPDYEQFLPPRENLFGLYRNVVARHASR